MRFVLGVWESVFSEERGREKMGAERSETAIIRLITRLYLNITPLLVKHLCLIGRATSDASVVFLLFVDLVNGDFALCL